MSADAKQKEAVGRRFARNAASLRRRSGLSQDETAERAGLHRTQVSLLERGLRIPQLDTIVQLAGGIGAEPCELFVGVAWRLDRGRLQGRERTGSFEVRTGQRWEAV